MKILKLLAFHLVEDKKKVFSTQILIEVEVVEPHLKVDTEICMVDMINMNVNLMEVDEETLKEGGVMETMVEVIKVNNQTATIMKNLSTWQITIIKRSMMHKMENCNKGIMHQLTIKVMKNYL
jgi:hypothetical protein